MTINQVKKPVRRYLPKFREWIRAHSCLIADASSAARIKPPAAECDGFAGLDWRVVIECAHVKSRGSGGDDPNNLVPLCGKHHRWGSESLHLLGIKSFERRWGLSLKKIARQLYREWQAAR